MRLSPPRTPIPYPVFRFTTHTQPYTTPARHPSSRPEDQASPPNMGSSGVFAKTILIPALIALTIYILATCLILPIFRRYHQRYSQYLPLHNISAHTLSLRDRIADAIMRFFLPSTWRRGAHVEHDTISIDDDEGEILVGMDMDAARREALERRRGSVAEAEGRLSRDLEEGFMDDSDEEDHHGGGRR
ncbi:uncharacterized protein N7446_013670 [Penicillium canescens]|uniref:Uncharacterized protein n=1 Tax=Penicillium canescens TaxID=5083 RepID=A0AAD6HZE0_PENCN|nr:uncharacterized protein N7446_013670 [Penicillium canescens]KAJ6023310.1 hypothetical protein N7460_013705 [Penicillium canescens]KAJ6025418.1 hypothetical protein N7444_013097 [Penicillium canescens]KAJ6042604.1 hypothetical protein N7446_013670 [Penicillium canescens]